MGVIVKNPDIPGGASVFRGTEYPSKRFSITSKAENHSKTFWKDFPPSPANPQSLLSKKRNAFSSLAL